MYQRILLAFDGSDSSKAALGEAARLARLTGGVVQVVYVVDEAPAYPFTAHYDGSLMNRELHRRGQAVLERACGELAPVGVTYRTDIVEMGGPSEDVAASLRRYAEHVGADIVVMGTHGRSGVQHAVLGSVAERFVREAPCPVLVVRGAGNPVAAGESCSNF